MPVRVRVRVHRALLRAEGLRPLQIWVPDVRSPDFRAEAHRQSAMVAAADQAQQDQAFVDTVSVEQEWNSAKSGQLPGPGA
jgi:hypothetical protein